MLCQIILQRHCCLTISIDVPPSPPPSGESLYIAMHDGAHSLIDFGCGAVLDGMLAVEEVSHDGKGVHIAHTKTTGWVCNNNRGGGKTFLSSRALRYRTTVVKVLF